MPDPRGRAAEPYARRNALIMCGLVFVVFILLLARENRARAGEEDVDTAIVFVVDVSTSMKADEVALARAAHAAALVSPEVATAIADGATGMNGGGRGWQWDGNREEPTLSPSIFHHNGPNDPHWHGWLRAGMWVQA